MRTRRLTLQRETLTTLSTDELVQVAGADHTFLDPECVLTPRLCFDIEQSVLPCYTRPCTS